MHSEYHKQAAVIYWYYLVYFGTNNICNTPIANYNDNTNSISPQSLAFFHHTIMYFQEVIYFYS